MMQTNFRFFRGTSEENELLLSRPLTIVSNELGFGNHKILCFLHPLDSLIFSANYKKNIFFLCFLCWKCEYFRMFFVRIYFDFNFSFLFLSMRIVFFTYFWQNQKKIKRNWSPLNADHFRFLSELWKVSERFLLLNRCTYECKLKIFNGRSAHNIDIEFLNARVWWWTLCDDDNQIISHVVFVGRLCYTASRCRTYVIAAHTHTHSTQHNFIRLLVLCLTCVGCSFGRAGGIVDPRYTICVRACETANWLLCVSSKVHRKSPQTNVWACAMCTTNEPIHLKSNRCAEKYKMQTNEKGRHLEIALW